MRFLALQCLALTVVFPRGYAQAPGVLWTTNLGARVFAVDEQTNVYANAGGALIKLNFEGTLLQTNTVCPRSGLAQRDALGNLYFAGVMPTYSPGFGYQFGSQDFGGVVVSGTAGFLAKYTSAGTLVWAVSFGPTWVRDFARVTDLQVTASGVAYVAYNYNASTTQTELGLARFDAAGAKTWEVPLPDHGSNAAGNASIGGITETGGHVLDIVSTVGGAPLSLYRFDRSGVLAPVSSWSNGLLLPLGEDRPIGNSAGEIYNVEGDRLTKRNAAGTIAWQTSLGSSPRWWTVAPDLWNGVFATTADGGFARFDYDGNYVWTLRLPARCVALVADSTGNRFFSMGDGSVASLGGESLTAPVITNSPQGQTVLYGSNAVFSVGASGFSPLRYFWRFNGSTLAGQTYKTLTLNPAVTANAGWYSVIVSNFVGSVTSAPVLLRVKSVAIFVGDQLLTNGAYFFPSPPMFNVRSRFFNGSLFYTLDGSPPSFASTLYTGPFSLSQSATVRAIGYSADFSQWEEADSVTAEVLVQHTLTSVASGGGGVSLSPSGGVYAWTNVVTAMAQPSPGWSFLYWLGDAPATNPTISISMERDKVIQAVFGTTLSTTVAGGGQIVLSPPDGLYPYGSVLRLTAVPDPGNYFGSWGNAATGNANPLYFAVVSPRQIISSIFGLTPASQAALTLEISGHGEVNASPRANAYILYQYVSVIAVPEPGQNFLGWSGDAAGSANPLEFTMNTPKRIMANFSSRPTLRADRPGLEGFIASGFRFTLVSDPRSVHQIFGTTNLSVWENLGTVTNDFGEVQFTDPSAPGFGWRFYQSN